jgi:hypothetical protein
MKYSAKLISLAMALSLSTATMPQGLAQTQQDQQKQDQQKQDRQKQDQQKQDQEKPNDHSRAKDAAGSMDYRSGCPACHGASSRRFRRVAYTRHHR